MNCCTSLSFFFTIVNPLHTHTLSLFLSFFLSPSSLSLSFISPNFSSLSLANQLINSILHKPLHLRLIRRNSILLLLELGQTVMSQTS